MQTNYVIPTISRPLTGQRTAIVTALLKTLRPHQWTKNAFIFAALIFDLKLFQVEPLVKTVLGFTLFCLISGAVYLINDLVDIDKDRQHPTKRFRPLPSGQLPLNVARTAAILLPALALPLSFWLNPWFGLVALGYLLLQTAYSFFLKNQVIVDVLAIAAGFVLRVTGGIILIEATRFSPWLYLVTVLLALFLALGKRRQELVQLTGHVAETRPILQQYNLPVLDQMISLVTTGVIMTYALYTFSATHLPGHLMMLTVPFIIYGIFRYLYVIHVQGNGGAPDEVLLTDRPLQINMVLFGLATLVILYLL